MRKRISSLTVPVLLCAAIVGCTVPNPNRRYHDAGGEGISGDAPPSGGPAVPGCTANQTLRCDGTTLVSCNADGNGEVNEPCAFGCNPNEKRCAAKPGPVCSANQALRCDGTNLVRCNADGSGEAIQPCSLACNAAEKRCAEMVPSNGLGRFFELARNQPDLNLGVSAKIDTDTGVVTIDGTTMTPASDIVAQANAPTIRVFPVGSLTANTVVVSGKNALAFVSNGEIKLVGSFVTASINGWSPGVYGDATCGSNSFCSGALTDCSGAGGSGFGSPGGSGGAARGVAGGRGGAATGNESLVPLRGGCGGRAGGAIQLVSRSQINIAGTVAANGLPGAGAGRSGGGGGASGGGILLEAPIVTVLGTVVANGGAGGGCRDAEATHVDSTSAVGSIGCMIRENGVVQAVKGGGGNGAAGSSPATNGVDGVWSGPTFYKTYGGGGGGGVGRIRVNTASGTVTGGTFSPSASTGMIASH